jgi:transcriptional regulator with XRE-family HTH domain
MLPMPAYPFVMPYRKRDKPPFAAWLVAEREGRKWKAEEVARRLREAGYRTWESSAGRRPAPETVAALERLFGSPAPGAEAQPSGDLAAAITALTVELRAWREEDRERLAELEATVAGLVAGALAGPGTAAGATPPARTRSAG